MISRVISSSSITTVPKSVWQSSLPQRAATSYDPAPKPFTVKLPVLSPVLYGKLEPPSIENSMPVRQLLSSKLKVIEPSAWPQFSLVEATVTCGVSATLRMVCEAETVFPHASVAVQVRTITSSQLSTSAEVSLKVTSTSPQLSWAVTSAGEGTWPHAYSASAGTPISTGASLSSMVRVWVQV